MDTMNKKRYNKLEFKNEILQLLITKNNEVLDLLEELIYLGLKITVRD